MTTNQNNAAPSTPKATLPLFNRMARVLPGVPEIANVWTPLSAIGTPEGSGMVIRRTTETGVQRALVPAAIAKVVDAFHTSHPKGCLAAIGHGVRFVLDGETGVGSPFFLEAGKVASRQLYVFGMGGEDMTKGKALVAKLEAEGVALEATHWETKGGLYITLPADMTEDAASALVRVLSATAVTTKNNGYTSNMGAPLDVDAIDPADIPNAPQAEAKGRGRPSGAKDKQPRKQRSKREVQAEAKQEA